MSTPSVAVPSQSDSTPRAGLESVSETPSAVVPRVATKVRWFDHVVGAVFATSYIAILFRTARNLGYARDEGFYFDAGRSYARWIELLIHSPHEALQRQVIDSAWNVNHEHPSLMKTLFGLSWLLFHEGHVLLNPRLANLLMVLPCLALGVGAAGYIVQRRLYKNWRLAAALGAAVAIALVWCRIVYFFATPHPNLIAEAGTSFRLPGMLMAGLSLWLVYVMGTRAYSRRAGFAAALCLALMPRIFYHSHLDCFDVPVMFWWTLVVYCYWRSLEGPWWSSLVWAVLTGVAWGFALDVKFNVFLLPAVFTLHWFVARGRDEGATLQRGGFSVPTAVLAMVTIGLATFIALWPWMWFDTFVGEGGRPGRLGEYLGFHWNHPYYNIEYFGFNYFRPPFPRSYPYVMIAFTVPAITLVLFAVGLVVARGRQLLRDLSPLAGLVPPIGAARRLRAWSQPREGDDPRATDLLFAASGYAILALWLKPNTPIFGGTKHWFTVYPFLALFAGAGFDATVAAFERALGGRVRPKWLPAAAMAGVCFLAPLAITAHSHPFGLSSYTPLAGGTPGGADHGMNRQFWGYTTGSLVEFLNREVPPNGSVFIHDTAWPSWEMLQSDGRVRRDIRVAWDVASADLAIVHHELHMNEVDYQIWQSYQSPAVFYVLAHDGVPIISVYRRPGSRPAPGE